jgi:UDPglucose 6-dehydrogenase
MNLERVKKLLHKPVIVDLRNVYDPVRMKTEGFTYVCVGRSEDARIRERV